MKFIIIRKQWIFLAVLLFLAFASWYLVQPLTIFTSGETAILGIDIRFIWLQVNSPSETEEGKEIEAYRWDPGTIVVPKGEDVSISIYGVNGQEHPFYIEGTDYKGTVQKGKETRINVKFDAEGTYRLICLTHSAIEKNGPMIGYIIVD